MNRSAGSSPARDGRAPGVNGPALADEAAADEHELAEAPEAEAAPEGRENELALGVAAGIERLLSLLRWLTPPDGLSFTAAATLATLDRSGPCRLTLLAVNEGVTQPAMTQLVARLQ